MRDKRFEGKGTCQSLYVTSWVCVNERDRWRISARGKCFKTADLGTAPRLRKQSMASDVTHASNPLNSSQQQQRFLRLCSAADSQTAKKIRLAFLRIPSVARTSEDKENGSLSGHKVRLTQGCIDFARTQFVPRQKRKTSVADYKTVLKIIVSRFSEHNTLYSINLKL